MFSCYSGRRSQKRPSESDLVLSVQIRTTSQAGYQISKLAVLTVYDNENDVNLVSPKLINDVLGMSIQPTERTMRTPHINGGTTEIQGYVDVSWAPESSSSFNFTRFLVTKHPNPQFDLIMSREDAGYCGLAIP